MSSRKCGPRPAEMGLAAVVAIVLAVNPDDDRTETRSERQRRRLMISGKEPAVDSR
jgi:hypothetical protein